MLSNTSRGKQAAKSKPGNYSSTRKWQRKKRQAGGGGEPIDEKVYPPSAMQESYLDLD